MVESCYVGEAYIQGMLDREASFSVAIGSHVAIPHGTNDVKPLIKKTGVVVMTYPDGIDWNGDKVKLVVGIAAKGLVVTDVSNDRIARARRLIPEEEAARHGIKLVYVNPNESQDQFADLMALTGGKGYDDIFVYAPIRPLAEMADKLLGFDGCMNFFAGPSNKDFTAEVNLYNCHYTSTHIMGTTGGNTDDLKECLRLSAQGKIRPAVMVTHVGGIDSIVDTTTNLPNIPGGKKLTYTQFDMPLTAIEDFREKGKTDPLFARLADSCDAHGGLWNAEAEKILFQHFGVK